MKKMTMRQAQNAENDLIQNGNRCYIKALVYEKPKNNKDTTNRFQLMDIEE